MMQDKFSLELTDWCQTLLGRFTILSNYSQSHSESFIWRLGTSEGFFYLKAYQRLAKWGMEVHAYQNWVSALGGKSPQLIAVLDKPPTPAILLTELPGMTMNQVTLSRSQEQSLWHAAGATLARMHALPSGEWFGVPLADGTPLSEFPEQDPVILMSNSLEEYFSAAINHDLLNNREITTVKTALNRLDVFAEELPAPCHGDYQPRNWIVSQGGTWQGVIDFEHARWDLKINDLGYWWDKGLWERPDLQESFLEGYGRLREAQQEQLYIIRILGAVARICWGYHHQDEATGKLGHETLKILDNS